MVARTDVKSSEKRVAAGQTIGKSIQQVVSPRFNHVEQWADFVNCFLTRVPLTSRFFFLPVIFRRPHFSVKILVDINFQALVKVNALLVNAHFDPDNWPSKKTAERHPGPTHLLFPPAIIIIERDMMIVCTIER
jgi:hypothetical protein